MSSTSAPSPRITASSRSTRASWPRRAPRARSPTSTAMPACCCYRGYPIEQLAEHSTLPGSVPTCCCTASCRTRSRSRSSPTNIQRHTMINESLLRMYNGFHYNAHPMAHGERRSWPRCRRSTTTRWTSITRATARSSRTASSPRSRRSRPPPTSIRSASRSSTRATISATASNLLHMFYAVPCEPYNVDPLAAEALDLLLILHADHEQNASTSTVRLAGSHRRQPLCRDLRGRLGALGPGAWRRQRGRARDARVRSARSTTSRSSSRR